MKKYEEVRRGAAASGWLGLLVVIRAFLVPLSAPLWCCCAEREGPGGINAAALALDCTILRKKKGIEDRNVIVLLLYFVIVCQLVHDAFRLRRAFIR